MALPMESQGVRTDCKQLLDEVRRVAESGRTRDLQWRLDQLAGIERLCTEREGEIAAALADDLGRSPVEAWLGDINATKTEASFARKHLKKWMRHKRVSLPLTQLPGRGWVQYDPLGVVLVIGPWNYPVFTPMGSIAYALAAGNAVIRHFIIMGPPEADETLPDDPRFIRMEPLLEAGAKALAILAHRAFVNLRPSRVKVHAGAVLLEHGLVEADFDDLAAAGCRLVGEIGISGVKDPAIAAQMTRWAQAWPWRTPRVRRRAVSSSTRTTRSPTRPRPALPAWMPLPTSCATARATSTRRRLP